MNVCMYVCLYVSRYVCMYVCMYVFIHVYMYVCMYLYTYVCMRVCMFVCVYVCCMYVGYVHIMAPLCSVLSNGVCMYHRQVSYGRHMCVSRTALTDLTFIDSSQINDTFTRAHLIQNKVKNCVMNGWIAIILAACRWRSCS